MIHKFVFLEKLKHLIFDRPNKCYKDYIPILFLLQTGNNIVILNLYAKLIKFIVYLSLFIRSFLFLN